MRLEHRSGDAWLERILFCGRQPRHAKRRTHLRQNGTQPDRWQGAVMKWPRLLLLAVVLALLAWAWVALHPSPEKLIRKQLDGVARAASFEANQGTLAKLAGAESLEDFFSTNVEIKIDVPGHREHRMMGRSEIPQVAMGVRASVRSLSVAF